MDKKTQKKVAPRSQSCDTKRADAVYSKRILESVIVLHGLAYAALSLGRPRKQDPRRAADIYSECALDSIIALFGLSNEALSVGHPPNQPSPDQVKDLDTSASHAVRQSEGEQRANLHKLSDQNSKLSKKLRAARKHGVELRRELEKCPTKDWWEIPVNQLSLEEPKFHKRNDEELRKILIQAIGDRTADCACDNSNNPPMTNS